MTILWLGQSLTTDIGEHGSRAAAEVHDRVREDLLVDDIADEGQTLARDLPSQCLGSERANRLKSRKTLPKTQ